MCPAGHDTLGCLNVSRAFPQGPAAVEQLHGRLRPGSISSMLGTQLGPLRSRLMSIAVWHAHAVTACHTEVLISLHYSSPIWAAGLRKMRLGARQSCQAHAATAKHYSSPIWAAGLEKMKSGARRPFQPHAVTACQVATLVVDLHYGGPSRSTVCRSDASGGTAAKKKIATTSLS